MRITDSMSSDPSGFQGCVSEGGTKVMAVLGDSVNAPSRRIFTGSFSSSPSFLSFLHLVNCLPPLQHLTVFNIASKAADFKLNPTTWSVTKPTWEVEPCTSVLHVWL